MMLNMSLIFAGLLSAAIQNTHNMYLKKINARDKYHKNNIITMKKKQIGCNYKEWFRLYDFKYG